MSRRRLVSRLIYLLIAGAVGVSLYRLDLLDPGEVAPAASRLAEFSGSLFPPNTGVLPTLLRAMLETIEIAFVADNPGKWLLHCHMLEHSASGMMTWFAQS